MNRLFNIANYLRVLTLKEYFRILLYMFVYLLQSYVKSYVHTALLLMKQLKVVHKSSSGDIFTYPLGFSNILFWPVSQG